MTKKQTKQIQKKKKITKNVVSLPETKLRFSPKAWFKILYMRETVDVEVSGFGITSTEDPLYVEDFKLIKQISGIAHTDMDDEAVANHMEDMAEEGFHPVECMRIWIHTHPSNSATPSMTDKETFLRVFGQCNWSVMFIMAHEGNNTAHLMINTGDIQSVFKIPTEIDYANLYSESWDEELFENVEEEVLPVLLARGNRSIVSATKDTKKQYDYGYGFEELMEDDDISEDFAEMHEKWWKEGLI